MKRARGLLSFPSQFSRKTLEGGGHSFLRGLSCFSLCCTVKDIIRLFTILLLYIFSPCYYFFVSPYKFLIFSRNKFASVQLEKFFGLKIIHQLVLAFIHVVSKISTPFRTLTKQTSLKVFCQNRFCVGIIKPALFV